jgi:hypothetical protein
VRRGEWFDVAIQIVASDFGVHLLGPGCDRGSGGGQIIHLHDRMQGLACRWKKRTLSRRTDRHRPSVCNYNWVSPVKPKRKGCPVGRGGGPCSVLICLGCAAINWGRSFCCKPPKRKANPVQIWNGQRASFAACRSNLPQAALRGCGLTQELSTRSFRPVSYPSHLDPSLKAHHGQERSR